MSDRNAAALTFVDTNVSVYAHDRSATRRQPIAPVVEIDGPLIAAASRLEEEHTLSFWDALIAESALRGRASRLMSEDLRSGRSLAGLSIVNPFDEQR